MNIIKRVISRLFKKPPIPENIMEHCVKETSKQNQSRFWYSSPIVIIAITTITAGYIFHAAQNGMKPILLAHIITDSVYLFFILCFFLIMKISPSFREKKFDSILHIVFFASLLWAAVFCVFDRNMMNITMGLFLYSIIFAIKPRVFLHVELSILLPLLAVLSFCE